MDSATRNHTPIRPTDAASPPRQVEEWEDWENDDTITPIEPAEQVLIHNTPYPSDNTHPTAPPRYSASRPLRYPSTRVKRLKSRHRQRAQNAKAGIKLITDMSSFRRHNQAAQQMRTPEGRPGKFVDAATLRALEGDPSSATVGNWNWLKRNKVASPAQELSPEDRPIVIGISLPSDVASSRAYSPQTAVSLTAEGAFNATSSYSSTSVPTLAGSAANEPKSVWSPDTPDSSQVQLKSVWSPDTPATAQAQLRSVWSPDTPDTATSFASSRCASSLYSQITGPNQARTQEIIPPVPALPTDRQLTSRERHISVELGAGVSAVSASDENASPCTLFEEDGTNSPQGRLRTKVPTKTPDSAGSRSHGWWDHVTTPFTDKRLSFQSRITKLESPREELEESNFSPVIISEKHEQTVTTVRALSINKPPIVRVPTPRRTPSPILVTTPTPRSDAAAVTRSNPAASHCLTEKQAMVVSDSASEQLPPYSPQRSAKDNPVRYRAVFPPGHPLHSQFPPSPGPISPGVSGTMTSQGAQMIDIPLTPVHQDGLAISQTPLPNRPAGSALPAEHAYAATGRANKIERQRRRHEREDVAARRVGGLWRGRGCIPSSGCFGRSGREGRKRRRVWMIILLCLLGLIVTAIVLGVVLTRPKPSQEEQSIWVNLTDYPPMPTGVLTVVGPDNTVANSGCTEPRTLWSCSLPKEQHESVAPYKPNQPTVTLQIEWDNSTEEHWNVPNGEPPAGGASRRAPGLAARAAQIMRLGRKRSEGDFEPKPSPPDFKEMWFLGNTTDGIESDQKAGEPTPFYISLPSSDTVNLTSADLVRRQERAGDIGDASVPPPALEDDGSSAPAVMLPQPVQQPVRLYDRGLPTEHYGFYTYFKRTLFLRSVTVLNGTDEDDVPLDENGGSRKNEANFLTTWSETRVLVQIWTRTLNESASLLRPGASAGINGSTTELIRPGTMPYPVTITMDTHGGQPGEKLVWALPIDERAQVVVDEPKRLANVISAGGTLVNPRANGDETLGGFDGGNGGCKCQWVNWT